MALHLAQQMDCSGYTQLQWSLLLLSCVTGKQLLLAFTFTGTKQTPLPESSSELYGRILGFLDRSRYFSFK
jgi:hypothetical protein